MFPSLRERSEQLPLLGGTHRHPPPDLISGTQTADAEALSVERADIDARGRRTLGNLGRRWINRHPYLGAAPRAALRHLSMR
jgi:hypothetical protein